MGIEIIITTWGNEKWGELARHVAFPSAVEQAPTYMYHHEEEGCSAGEARNAAVDFLDPSDWIIFLDADDTLAPGYVDAMTAVAKSPNVLHAPALKLGADDPRCFEDRDIIDGLNPCPIGTMIHREMFELVGGFWDEPAWEDWSLFRRCVYAGYATIQFVPAAVYNANSQRNGRNSTVTNPLRLRRNILISHDEWIAS